MRVRSDVRRQAIVDAAAGVFQEMGYERASMSTISTRLGGSKATLYSYFTSKENLFAAVMAAALEDQAEQLLGIISGQTGDIRSRLDRFARAYIAFVSLPEVLSITRMAIAEGTASQLGETLYENGPLHAWQLVAEMLEGQMQSGVLRKADPLLAAYQLKGLLDTGLVEPALYGAPPILDRETVGRSAVDVFLLAYGT